MSGFMHMRLKHLVEDRDRHGNVRLYVRLPGRGKVRIRERPHTDEFMVAYHAAVAGAVEHPRQARQTKPGSFRHLCRAYYASGTFKRLDGSTQNWRRRELDSLCIGHAEKPVAMMQGTHIRKARDARKTPGTANARLKALKALFAWAVEAGEAPHDPTIGVKKISYVTQGHHAWTVDEIEQYKARHLLGTKARLALDLLRFTTGRREDAVRFGKQHVRDGRVRFRQAKNEHRNPVDIDIPMHLDLARSIAATPIGNMTFMITEFGRPFTPNGFGNKFKDWCRQADLPHCSAHGLRKATPTQMAEAGATAHELMAITGHRSLEEVERYTRTAARGKLADAAMSKLKG